MISQAAMQFSADLPKRIEVWTRAVSAARQLADEWQDWLRRPDLERVEPLT